MESTLFPPEASAAISACGTWRYRLGRRWAYDGTTALFVMLNPSTADADVDDPTIRRCIGFAKSWGHSALEVVNLFAFRATDPKALPRDSIKARGPSNGTYVDQALAAADVVVAAWGAWRPSRHGLPIQTDITSRAREQGRSLYCLGKTKDGAPRHPLYVKADQPLEVYRA